MTALPIPPTDLLRGSSLFLDFDGTLVEIADRPDAVSVDARLAELMRRLSGQLDGRIAVISGRAGAEVRELLGACVATIVGSHGLEFHRPGGQVEMVERPPALDRAAAAMRDLAAEIPGLLVEDKPLGAALHFRQVPSAEQASIALALRLAADFGLELQHGKMMVELRAAGGDKGSAVRALMREPPFAATRPVFMGDDLTDEAGFLAARTLGGAAVLVGPERSTTAEYRLGSVADTLAWLADACEALA